MDKRTFIKNASMAGLGSMLNFDGLSELVRSVSAISPAELAVDEDFRANVRKGYKIKPDYINLENGYYNFIPEQAA
ncbi:MAG: hypothetical protein MZU84_07600 [Sphingobacterium sp.]|nr:hypothetical protein [Sphingobacterium sp.]